MQHIRYKTGNDTHIKILRVLQPPASFALSSALWSDCKLPSDFANENTWTIMVHSLQCAAFTYGDHEAPISVDLQDMGLHCSEVI